jgi:predicted secreted protein
VTEPEFPGELVLRPGESHVLRLPGRGLSGYRWEPAVEGSAVEIHRESSASGGAPGAAGDELVTLRAVTIGRATVTVVRRRRWGPPGEAAEAETVRIDIAVVDT